VRRLIRAAGAKLFFLPRYSPDLNPIEEVFAKLKTLLRKTDPRTIEATWHGIGTLLDRFTPQECANNSPMPAMLSLTRSRSKRHTALPAPFSDDRRSGRCRQNRRGYRGRSKRGCIPPGWHLVRWALVAS